VSSSAKTISPLSRNSVSLMPAAFEALEGFRWMLFGRHASSVDRRQRGWLWLSTRALAPVDEISRAAQRISIENLTDRLKITAVRVPKPPIPIKQALN
jgi:hypothetical protein